MPLNRYRFYVGPLGNLRPTPPLPGGANVEAPLTFPGGEHTSLSGEVTQDRGGRARRVWPLSWEWLTEDDEQMLQAMVRGYMARSGKPLRMIDPRKRNLLPEDVSVAGAETLSVESFLETGTGTVAYLSGDVPTDFAGLVPGALNWAGVVATSSLRGNLEQTPVVAGSIYRFSCYLKGTGTYRLAAWPYNSAGVEQAVVDSGSTVAATGAWQRFSWAYTPAVGIDSFLFGLVAQTAGTTLTALWQAQVDQELLPWAVGYGCPEVVVISPGASAGYWRTKYHRLSLTLREA